MEITKQQQNEAFSVATLLYTRLRKVISRVIDVMYLIENKDYARYILNLAEQTNDAELLKYANRLNEILQLTESEAEKENSNLLQEDKIDYSSEPTSDEVYRAQVSHHYIGALR